MKAIKIILAVAVVAVIVFFVWKWLVKIDHPGTVPPPENQFTARIESEIDSLKNFPTNVFCQKFYSNIQYQITDYYKQGLLGNSENDNKQMKENLSKMLYSYYASKFVEQAMYVFNGSEWKIEDMNFIRNEVRTLESSAYFEQGTSTLFKNIHGILAKYDEIAIFISTCNSFSYSYYGLDDRFPDVSDKIKKSQIFLGNNLDNSYVNNCIRLKEGLRGIPQKLFSTHIDYLLTKIQQNSNQYTRFKSQAEYMDNIYTPLRNQIESLNNKVYGIADNTFNNGLSNLNNLLSSDYTQARDYLINITK